jgi:hypothetical protein
VLPKIETGLPSSSRSKLTFSVCGRIVHTSSGVMQTRTRPASFRQRADLGSHPGRKADTLADCLVWPTRSIWSLTRWGGSLTRQPSSCAKETISPERPILR